jgi:hypothetical protein
MLLGVTQGCGTNEPARGALLGSDAGDAGGILVDDAGGITVGSRTPFGKPCLKDTDCGGRGIICLPSDSKALGGGGPPNGMCVADCSTDPTVCGKLDPSATCVGFSDTPVVAYCLQRCVIGTPPTGDEKCHKRLDTACFQGTSASGAGFCSPQCRNDADCGARKCDLASGLCMDAKDLIGTLAIGSPCDAGLPKDPCRGFCLPLNFNDAGTGPGMCTGFCPLGSLGCGSDPASPTAACLFAYTSADEKAGDLGICGQLCDCNDECKTEGRACRPFTDPNEVAAFGHAGYCGGAVDSGTGKPAESIACGDAGAPHDADASPPSTDGGPDAH